MHRSSKPPAPKTSVIDTLGFSAVASDRASDSFAKSMRLLLVPSSKRTSSGSSSSGTYRRSGFSLWREALAWRESVSGLVARLPKKKLVQLLAGIGGVLAARLIG